MGILVWVITPIVVITGINVFIGKKMGKNMRGRKPDSGANDGFFLM